MWQGDCSEVRKLFLDLEEGAPRSDELAEVRGHLESCAECREAWDRWQAEGRLLADALRPEIAPRDIAGPALAQIRHRKAAPAPARLRPRLLWGLAAAAAVAAVVAGALLLRTDRYPQIGTVASTLGQPKALQRGVASASVMWSGMAVLDGDQWLTGRGDEVEMGFDDGSRLTCQEGTKVELSGSAAASRCGHTLPHVCLQQGQVVCDLKSSKHFRGVGTPLGTAIATQARFRMAYEPGVRTTLEVISGDVEFSCPAAEVLAGAGSEWVVEAADGVPRLVSPKSGP